MVPTPASAVPGGRDPARRRPLSPSPGTRTPPTGAAPAGPGRDHSAGRPGVSTATHRAASRSRRRIGGVVGGGTFGGGMTPALSGAVTLWPEPLPLGGHALPRGGLVHGERSWPVGSWSEPADHHRRRTPLPAHPSGACTRTTRTDEFQGAPGGRRGDRGRTGSNTFGASGGSPSGHGARRNVGGVRGSRTTARAPGHNRGNVPAVARRTAAFGL